ncbi:ribose-phosphate diphosphokinase [Candidatus Woesearchaeota archaeon]|nr:ribose-phosphate diphosphokinase [Candidatus Woesearchaeota archaeon]
MIITSCGNSISLAQRLAKSLKVKFSPLNIGSFPDGDIYLRFNTQLNKQTVVIVNSFQPESNKALFNIVFAAQTAKDLGAKKVILVAPYLAYMRQDKRFNPGEAISSKIMARLLNDSIDKIITIDPHLHRYKSLKDIFTIQTKKLTTNPLIAHYVKKHIKNSLIMGPDWESYQWAEDIAKEIKVKNTVLAKTRYSSRHVSVEMKDPQSLKNKNIVIVDDIISTGHTMIEAAKKAKQKGAKSIIAIGVHGLFVENALDKMKKYFDQIITTNCIEHKTNKIDILPLLVEEIKHETR